MRVESTNLAPERIIIHQCIDKVRNQIAFMHNTRSPTIDTLDLFLFERIR